MRIPTPRLPAAGSAFGVLLIALSVFGLATIYSACDIGLDVAAFLGSSPQSTEKTKQVLAGGFGFQGNGYWDLGEMLAVEKPDVVVVSSPPELHLEHSVLSLAAGAHVICEKPIVWGNVPPHIMRQDSRAMAQAAADSGRVLTFNTQYVVAVPYIYDLGGDLGPPETVFFEMEAKGAGGTHEYEEILVDLVPHPISFLLAAAPGGAVVEESIDCRVGKKETIVELAFTRPDGGICQARFELRNIQPDQTPSRRMGINDCVAHYEGRNDGQGQFRAYLRCGDKEIEYDDFVLTTMTAFVEAAAGAGAPMVSVEEALKGFDLHLQLHDLRYRVES